MKIKKIIDKCKREGLMFLYTDENAVQWICDGRSIYPLYNLPQFDFDSLCNLYDVNEKQKEKIRFTEKAELPSRFDFSDVVPSETFCERQGLRIISGGRVLVPYQTTLGIAFFDNADFSPIEIINGNELEVYERFNAVGEQYFTVKSGFMLQAVILPYECINDYFVKNLKIMYQQSEMRLENEEQENEEC